jgi:hypothetical protein
MSLPQQRFPLRLDLFRRPQSMTVACHRKRFAICHVWGVFRIFYHVIMQYLSVNKMCVLNKEIRIQTAIPGYEHRKPREHT